MFWIQILVAVALNIIAYLLAPKAKKTTPETVKDMENPVATAGDPIAVLFGSMTIKGINYLWFGEKMKHKYQVRA